MAAEPGLRERKKQQTRQLLADTARRLFVERGFERVPIAEIARAADVSEATVFNYFPSKEDLVYARMEVFEEELLAAVRDRPPDEPISAAFGRFVLRPRGLLAAPDPAAARDLADVTRMIARSPALLERERRIFDRYTDSLAALIASEMGVGPDDPAAWVAANALMGVHRALIDLVRRRIAGGDTDLDRLAADVRAEGARALAMLDRGLGHVPPQTNTPSWGG
jgi:AcrR family transcriptional regulator